MTTTVTEKPFCMVCSNDALTNPKSPLRFNICSQKCKLELWKCLGIIKENPEEKDGIPFVSRDFKHRISTIDEENLMKAVIK